MKKNILAYFCLIFMSFQAKAETTEDLKSQIKDLEKRIKIIEEKEKSNNSFDFGKISLGGYIKVDLIHDMASSGGDSTFLPTISMNKNTGDKTRIHARESRFNITYKDKSDYGDIKAFIEVDFFGTKGTEDINNSDGLRLRQAYGEVGNFLFGQTWSNFTDLDSVPETLDFGNPEGINATRQAQFRYTLTKNAWTTAFSIENPESDFIDSNGDSSEKSDKIPDLILSTKYKYNSGYIALAGVYRQISASNGTQSDTANAYGLSISGTQKIYKKDNIKFRFNYGDGIGRYIRDAYKHSASLDQNNYKLDTQEAYAFFAGYQHFWLDNLRSTLAYGLTKIDNNTNVIGVEENKKLESIHLNLICSLKHNIDLGIEYIYGKRELDNGDSGYVRRIQFSTKLKF
ncbi:MAG TPA: DcaP family trimeric outer membrane transporter [Rickettsiales bacterium]|nr:DcaP family trimeric outer membrane transporter [Rickettsiales bacterium]